MASYSPFDYDTSSGAEDSLTQGLFLTDPCGSNYACEKGKGRPYNFSQVGMRQTGPHSESYREMFAPTPVNADPTTVMNWAQLNCMQHDIMIIKYVMIFVALILVSMFYRNTSERVIYAHSPNTAQVIAT